MTNLMRSFIVLLFALTALPAHSRELAIDLTEDIVPITANFVGSDLLLYGAAEDSGGDVLVVVRGPEQDVTVRRKEQKAIIWANGKQVTFKDVPSFYFLSSTRPLEAFLSDFIANKEQIGYSALEMQTREQGLSDQDYNNFRKALIRNKQRQGLFGVEPGEVRFKGKHLFRAQLHFPANVPVGDYRIDIYVFQGRTIVSRQTTVLPIQKFGIEAQVYNFAHQHALPYGILAILLATFAGWFANVIFRKA